MNAEEMLSYENTNDNMLRFFEQKTDNFIKTKSKNL